MTPRRFALLVGNHNYDNPNLAQLSASTGDATDFAVLLRDGQLGGFDEVQTLIDLPVDEIRKSIARFFSSRSREDLLLLYFTGHGILDDRGKLYLAARDTEPDLLSATAIDAAFVTDSMDRCRSTRQVLILDCCHSGAFARGSKGVVGSSVGTATAFQGSGSGRVILTATDATQYAWEGDRIIGQAENSLFTHYLLEGLRTGKADLNQDGWVTLDEWYDYVFEQVIAATPKQTPAKWSYKQQGEIWVARNPNPVPQSSSLPKELQDSLADPRAWVREGAAAELIRLLQANPEMTQSAVSALQSLVMDDSRRVSSTAAVGLEAYQAQAGQTPGANPPAVEFDVPASPRLMKRNAPEPVLVSAAEAAEIPARGMAESMAVGQPANGAWGKTTEFVHSLSWIHSPLFPVITAWSLGWFLSLGLGLVGDDSRLLLIGWVIAGLCADLVLWRFYRAKILTRLPLLTAGWAISLLPLYLFEPVYGFYDNAGSDFGKAAVTMGFLLIWIMIAAFFSSFRILPVSQKTNWKRFVFTVVLCWGAAFLFTLLITGLGNWNTALIHFVREYPLAVKEQLGDSAYTYFALSANGILAAILGFYVWSRLKGVRQK